MSDVDYLHKFLQMLYTDFITSGKNFISFVNSSGFEVELQDESYIVFASIRQRHC